MAFDQRRTLAGEEGPVRLLQVVQEFGHVVVAPQRVRMDGLADGLVHPWRHVAVVLRGRVVAQLALGRAGAGLGHVDAVRQCTRQHLVDQHAQRIQVRARAALFAEEILGRHALQRARHGGVFVLSGVFADAGHAGGAEIDDGDHARAVDHDVFRAQVLVHHVQPVQGAQALRHLADDGAHHRQPRPRMVVQPLRQGLALDEFGQQIKEVARAAVRHRPQHVRTVDAARHPFLHQEAFDVGRIALQVGGGRLDHQPLPAVGVMRQVDVAAAAAVQFAHDPVAI